MKRPVIRVLPAESRWAQWESETRTITLSEHLIEKQPWDVVVEVMKHEMAHQIVSEEFGADEGHGPLFLRACETLGVANWARRAQAELGEPPPDWKTQKAGSPEERLLQRVEKLLALANSSNSFESIAAMKKVQELYLKYHLDRSAVVQKDGYVYLPLRLKRRRVERYQTAIASLLQDFFKVEVIHTAQYDPEAMADFKVIELLGRKEDVLLAEYVFFFLTNQLPVLWQQHGETGSRKRQNSFYLGVLAGFREKLESNQKELFSKDKSLALAVRKQDPGLEDFLGERYPRLVKIKHARLYQDGRSYDSGKEHGRKLVLKKGVESKSTQSGRFLPRK